MSRWWPAAYWVAAMVLLVVSLFIHDDTRKAFAVLFGLVLCLRGDTMELRRQLDEWRRI